MRRKIPATHTLLCFEAAARHESYTRAVQELALTQSAVSRQIGALEQFLGQALFRRTRHGVTLTERGAEYARQIAPRLQALERDTLDAMSGPGTGGRGPGAGRAVTLAAVAAPYALSGARYELFSMPVAAAAIGMGRHSCRACWSRRNLPVAHWCWPVKRSRTATALTTWSRQNVATASPRWTTSAPGCGTLRVSPQTDPVRAMPPSGHLWEPAIDRIIEAIADNRGRIRSWAATPTHASTGDT